MTGRRLVVEADGGSRGNPGPSGFGALVREPDGEVLGRAAERCGVTTNNVAEYSGLVAGLRMAAAVDPTAQVEVRMDSKLVVEQMSGRWKIKDRRLAGIAQQASEAFDPSRVRYTWIPRAANAAADRLANEAMDGRERPTAQVVAGLREERDDPSPGSGQGSADPVADAGEATEGARSRKGPGTARPPRPPQPEETTTLLLVRHGRTRLTEERRFSGAGGVDAPLTDAGRLDALGALPFLAGRSVQAVVTSPLLRARQTGDLLGEKLGWPAPAVDERWAEVAFGAWDGRTPAEVGEEDPELLRQWFTRADVAPPGGESMAQLEVRVQAALQSVVEAHRGAAVVVVCHMTPIRSVVRHVLGAGEQALWRLRCAPGALTNVRFWTEGAEIDGIGLHVPSDAPDTLF